jgi:hypothetical protein
MAFPGSAAQTAGQGPIITGNPAPSAEQIHSLILRTMANQHRDDRALEEFERTEHEISRKGQNTEIITDITERILPSGTGNMKLKTAEKGVPVSADDYRRQLETALKALETAMQPSERRNEDLAKFEKRRHDHAELLDEATKAFRVSWAGRETRNDSAGKRTLMKFLLDPDEEQAQFARLEADVATDISFGGGVAGKIYRGGHVVMVQEEVIPGIWLPTLFNYEVDGRKFIVAFGIHERTEISRYRRVGPPDQVAELLRADLKKLVAESSNR